MSSYRIRLMARSDCREPGTGPGQGTGRMFILQRDRERDWDWEILCPLVYMS